MTANKSKEIILNLPVLVTRGGIVFPTFEKKISVGREKSKNAVNVSKDNFANQIILVEQKQKNIEDPTEKDIHKFGILAEILNVSKLTGQMEIDIKAIQRVKIKSLNLSDDTWYATAKYVKDKPGDKEEGEELKHELLDAVNENLIKTRTISKPETVLPLLIPSIPLAKLADSVANLIHDHSIKEGVLKETNVNQRITILLDYIYSISSKLKIDEEVSSKIRDKLSDQQREFYLREKLRVIQDELNEISNEVSEFDEIRNKMRKGKFPAHIKERITKELQRLEKTPTAAAEYNVLRNYIDVVVDLPWNTFTDEVVKISSTKKQLDSDHFGLEKPKKRIIEYLALREFKKNKDDFKAQIICFVGPPGTGKTTLAKSIALSMGRKFVKIALGGIQDEAEIRGHRRTYVAAMPGKIITALKKIKVNNPLILLDEIDKLGSNMKGDPSSAMLEVLDPEQNKYFADHYVEEEFDLSKVMFIATANNFQNIPDALRDRMEVIELSSYTELEKVEIAEKHIIPTILKDFELNKKFFNWNSKLLLYLIRHYTYEAGVRSLKRELENIARKIIVMILNGEVKSRFTMSIKKIFEFLGPIQVTWGEKDYSNSPGIVNGLAWTAFGGDTLPIEVNFYKGEGKLILTGSQKEVMQESANIALGFLKSNSKKFNIRPEIFKENDIHINAPSGAIPKDGPSAGVTFTTALISALTKRKVSKTIAMTGEITLRGNVTKIGGLKEKAIGAHRAGVKTIYIPYENENSMVEIPEEVKKGIQFIPVKTYSEIYLSIFS